MTWLLNFFRPESVSGALVLLSAACALGLAVGAISVRGVKVGVAGVLFAGMGFGALGARVEPTTLAFLRDFGMTLFVYALGLQVGPGFLASLRRGGVRLNVLAAAVLVGGALFTMGLVIIFRVERTATPGLYVAGFTTTPGLVAAQQRFRGGEGASETINNLPERRRRGLELSGLIYALGYPFGCVAPIMVIVMVRWMFRVRLEEEKQAYDSQARAGLPRLTAQTLEMTNADLDGKPIMDIAPLRELGMVVGKIMRGNELAAAHAGTKLQLGDVLL